MSYAKDHLCVMQHKITAIEGYGRDWKIFQLFQEKEHSIVCLKNKLSDSLDVAEFRITIRIQIIRLHKYCFLRFHKCKHKLPPSELSFYYDSKSQIEA